jgi:hypothetical protein
VPRLTDERALILAALETGAVRTATAGRLAAPVVLVEPGDPWSEPARLPGRVSRWRLTAIAGRADTEQAYAELAALVDAVDAALRGLPGCSLPTWAMPRDVTLEGVPYAASLGTITYTTN